MRANGVIAGADRSKVTQDIQVLGDSPVNDDDEDDDDDDVRAPLSLYEQSRALRRSGALGGRSGKRKQVVDSDDDELSAGVGSSKGRQTKKRKTSN